MNYKHQHNGPGGWVGQIWQKRFHLLLQFALAFTSSLLAQVFLTLVQNWLR